MFRKAKKYEIPTDMANQALQNVFAACDKKPNMVPFDKLILRQKLNTGVYNRLICLVILLIVIVFTFPLAIVPISEYLEAHEEVNDIALVEDHVEDGVIYIKVSGKIDYEAVYLETDDGTVYSPVSWDSATGTLGFTYLPETESNIYIPAYRKGKSLHLLLSPVN